MISAYNVGESGLVGPVRYRYASQGPMRLRISDNVLEISCYGDSDFEGLQTQLRRINTPGSVISAVCPSCFYGCGGLREALFGKGMKVIGNSAFRDCEELSHVNVFDAGAGAVFENIGPHAFRNTGLTDAHLVLRGSYYDTSFDEYCFADCKRLSSVSLDQSTYLAPHMFDGCEMLRKVHLNNYHSYISEYAFANCVNLPSISFPPKTWGIMDHMLDGCEKLTSVVFEDPSNDRSQIGILGACVFNGCVGLSSIELPGSITSFSAIDPEFLKGSSVTRVKFNGISSDYFQTVIDDGPQYTEVEFETGVWHYAGSVKFNSNSKQVSNTQLSEIINAAKDSNCPIFTVWSKMQCSNCTNFFKNVINTDHFLNWMKGKRMLFAYVKTNSDNALRKFMEKSPFDMGNTLPFVGAYQLKEDGTIVALSLAYDKMKNYGLSVNKSSQEAWTSLLERTFDLSMRSAGRLAAIPIPAGIEDVLADPPDSAGEVGSGHDITDDGIDGYFYRTWYQDLTDVKKVFEIADDCHVPVVVGTGLPFCGQCAQVFRYRNKVIGQKDGENIVVPDSSTISFSGSGKFANPTVGAELAGKKYFYVFGALAGYLKGDGWVKTGDRGAFDYIMKKCSTKWHSPTVVLYWLKPNGALIKDSPHQTSNMPATGWVKRIREDFAGYTGPTGGGGGGGGGDSKPTVVIKDEIDTRGADHNVTYVSMDNKEFVCSNIAQPEYIAPERVDAVTTSDFKYGIWYYNARQLKAFADKYHQPVLLEFSSESCPPCQDFKINTFNNADFQREIKERNILLCRVETEGNFTTTGPQEYFVSHEWGSMTTAIPQLVFYWKKSDTDITKEVWNYNKYTDPANANYQTVLNKVDLYFAGHTPDPELIPPEITEYVAPDGAYRYRYYANQADDDIGRYFVVDERTAVDRVDDLQLEFETGASLQSLYPGADASVINADGNPPINSTYCYFTPPQARYDAHGYLFKIESDIVKWVYEFENFVKDTGGDSGGKSDKTGKWYTFDSTSSADEFKSMLGECRAESIVAVFFESQAENESSDRFRSNILESDEFKKWMFGSECMFIEVKYGAGGTFELGACKEFYDFKQATEFDGDTGQVPGFLVYHGCSTCTLDGSIAVYAKKKVTADPSLAVSYYTSLVDEAAEDS